MVITNEVLNKYNNIEGKLNEVVSKVEAALADTYSAKKSSDRDEASYKKAFAYILYTIIAAHNLSKYETSLNGYDLEKFQLDPVFSFLKLPRYVGLFGNNLDNDALVKYPVKEGFNPNPAEFIAAQQRVLFLFKKEYNPTSSLVDVVPVVSLANISEYNVIFISDDDMLVHYDGDNAGFPIIVPILAALVKRAYCSDDLQEFITLWVKTVVVNKLRN